MRASWSQFLRAMGWKPRDVDEIPDDYLVQEWFLFQTYNRNKLEY